MVVVRTAANAPSSSDPSFDESGEFPSEYESESEPDTKEKEIERVLADVSFEDLQKARANGFCAVKSKGKEEKVRRANKNRPTEISSKKPVGRYREVVQVPKKVVRDPRFESLCGTLDTDGFRKRYSFIYDNNLNAEKEKLRKLMKKSSDLKVIDDFKSNLAAIDKQMSVVGSNKQSKTAILSEHKKKEKEAAKQGKRPYYLKQSEIREKELIEKFNKLKESGKLESFIEKRRKKNAAKDHRYMPYRRTDKND